MKWKEITFWCARVKKNMQKAYIFINTHNIMGIKTCTLTMAHLTTLKFTGPLDVNSMSLRKGVQLTSIDECHFQCR